MNRKPTITVSELLSMRVSTDHRPARHQPVHRETRRPHVVPLDIEARTATMASDQSAFGEQERAGVLSSDRRFLSPRTPASR